MRRFVIERGMARDSIKRNPLMRYFATTSWGLERVLEQELRGLGAGNVRRASSGVSFTGDRRLMMRACLELRTAHRILWEVGVFKGRTPDGLHHRIRKGVDWQHLISPEKTFAVFANSSGEGFHDNRFVGLKIKDAICDRLRDDTGKRPSIDAEKPDVRCVARVRDGICQLSLDASGRSLHQRGYREEAGKAPLRESLAAALLKMSGWEAAMPLVDPMCGSGTLGIEAAMMARSRAPGLLGRTYGFQSWMGYRSKIFDAELARLEAAEREVPLSIFLSDHSRNVIHAACANAHRAGVLESLEFSTGKVEQLANPFPEAGPGILISNPPYGERINERIELMAIFAKLGEILRTQFKGWECWFLLPDEELIRSFQLRIGKQVPLKNGPLDVMATQLFVD